MDSMHIYRPSGMSYSIEIQSNLYPEISRMLTLANLSLLAKQMISRDTHFSD